MTVTLNELLMLVGRLDDSSGFDTPRERFRRFLIEHVTDAQLARPLIEQCQHAPGDQHHRALQDIVVALGRCLGFEAKFGSYLPAAGAHKTDGYWHSRRLDVVLEIRTDQTESTAFDVLSRSVAALATSHHSAARRTLGLCVVTPLYTSRARTDERQLSHNPDLQIRMATLGSLLFVGEMVSARRLTHDDVVRLLESELDLDFVVELLERAAGAAVTSASRPGFESIENETSASSWLATIVADQGATPEQFVEIVIGKRHVFGVGESETPHSAAQPGDRICLYIPGKGVVGHCQVRSIAEAGTGIRDAHRFSQLLHVDDTELHLNTPVALEEELLLRVRAARGRSRGTHALVRISRQEFDALATIREVDVQARRLGDVPSDVSTPNSTGTEIVELPVSAGGSRSHE